MILNERLVDSQRQKYHRHLMDQENILPHDVDDVGDVGCGVDVDYQSAAVAAGDGEIDDDDDDDGRLRE